MHERPRPVPSPWGRRHPPGPRSSLLAGLLLEARPKQWIKNVLLLAAPGAAGVLTSLDTLAQVLLGILAFCLTASGVYYVNDLLDVQSDRVHPVKRTRPIAAGTVPESLATLMGILLFGAGIALAALVGRRFVLVLVVYILVTTSYSFRFKNVPVVEMVMVAAGFLLRAVAGGVAADVPLSPLFLLVAAFGSLFMVAGKRHGELREMGEERAATRASLSSTPMPTCATSGRLPRRSRWSATACGRSSSRRAVPRRSGTS